jgi:hypothetical protein
MDIEHRWKRVHSLEELLKKSREAALAAADALSQGSPAFKSRWTWIESGLPK